MDWKPEKDTDSGKIVSEYCLNQDGLSFVSLSEGLLGQNEGLGTQTLSRSLKSFMFNLQFKD